MYARFTCETCFQDYDDEGFFVTCRGDACDEQVCKECAKKCKNPECKNWVCENCLRGSAKEYCGEYCIKCALWITDKNDEWKNFDFFKKKLTYIQAKKKLGIK
jgi:hypothetical protein